MVRGRDFWKIVTIFPEETKIADDLRKIKLSLDAPPPLTADQIAAHSDAAGLAALDLIVKKE